MKKEFKKGGVLTRKGYKKNKKKNRYNNLSIKKEKKNKKRI